MHRRTALSLLLALCAGAAAHAQDTTRGVRIGLRYDPSSKPGIVIMPVSGMAGDSIRAILARDFDYSDRFTVITLSNDDAMAMRSDAATGGLNYAVFGQMGAAAIVQATPTSEGVRVALHDVARAQSARAADFRLPPGVGTRDWRHAVHGVSDEVESWITGQPGIAQSRIAYIRGSAVHIMDTDGAFDQPIPVVDAAMSAAWHPSGNLIAYNTFGTGSRILLHDLRTGKTRDFGAQRNATYVTPVFAPDGKSMAYALASENGTDLYVVSLDGESFPRRVTIGRGSNNVQPSFSPEGNRLAFASDRTGTLQVYIMDADGTNADLFTAFDFGDQNYRTSPDWSPDGRQVTFQTRIDWRFQIFTMTLRDRQPRQLTSEGENEDPSWAPDGRHIVFSSTRSGARQLWILDAESGRLRQLTQTGGSRLAAWSPRLTAKER
jgi:TolB protein